MRLRKRRSSQDQHEAKGLPWTLGTRAETSGERSRAYILLRSRLSLGDMLSSKGFEKGVRPGFPWLVSILAYLK